jgi:hypothetical protein
VSYCMRCSAWVCRLCLAVVLWSCVVSCVHYVNCVTVTVRLVGSLSSPHVHDARSQEPETYYPTLATVTPALLEHDGNKSQGHITGFS